MITKIPMHPEGNLKLYWHEFNFCLVNAESSSKFGSGLFLLVQVVLLLDFIHGWNEKWVGYNEQFWWVLNSVDIYFSPFENLIHHSLSHAHSRAQNFCRYMALLVISLVCYVATFSFSGLLFYLFTPSGHDCGLNTFFIVMTLIFVFVFAIVTLHPAVSA